MKLKKIAALLLAASCTISILGGCSGSSGSASSSEEKKGANVRVESVVVQEKNDDEEEEVEEIKGPMRIAFLQGPTGLGAAGLMNEKDHGKLFGNYDFQVYTSPDEVTGKLINGELDVAAVPSNVAAVLYNKTGGEILVAAINTFGTLYILENGDAVNTPADLSGKTIVMAGQGAVPEYVLQFILNKSGVTDAEIKFVSSHAEAAAAIASGEAEIALLPEPFVSVATSKNADLRIALDVAAEWDKYSYQEEKVPNTLPMGCIVVRKAYIEQKENRFKKFLDEYEFFVDSANEDPALTAQYAVEYGIMDNAEITEKAIPNCNIQFEDGSRMMRLMKNFLEIMYEANPKSIGGTMPADEFYYIR